MHLHNMKRCISTSVYILFVSCDVRDRPSTIVRISCFTRVLPSFDVADLRGIWSCRGTGSESGRVLFHVRPQMLINSWIMASSKHALSTRKALC